MQKIVPEYVSQSRSLQLENPQARAAACNSRACKPELHPATREPASQSRIPQLENPQASLYTRGSLLRISQDMIPIAAPLATPEKIKTGK